MCKITINKKEWITIVLLLSATIYCFGFPKAKKYEGLNMLSQFTIPLEFNGWQGKNMEQDWSIEDETYNFIGQAMDREYVNRDGRNLFLLVLDAGDFHNPKICAHSSGFTVKELNDIEFLILNRTVRAHSLYVEKNAEGFLTIYWMCIDKDIVDWTEQKIKQLWFSLIDKKRAGLMIRLDVPVKEVGIEDAFRLAKEFLVDFSQAIPLDQVGYILGNPLTNQVRISDEASKIVY